MRLFMPLIPVGMLLAGCATAGSDPAAVCPPVVDYAPDVQARVAGEMEVASADAAWPDMIVDYGVLRAAVRACRDEE